MNGVIGLFRRERVFDRLGKKRSQRIVLEMVNRAEWEDECNPGEILEGHGAALGLCSYCLSPANDVRADICRKCRAEIDSGEEGPLSGMWPAADQTPAQATTRSRSRRPTAARRAGVARGRG